MVKLENYIKKIVMVLAKTLLFSKLSDQREKEKMTTFENTFLTEKNENIY